MYCTKVFDHMPHKRMLADANLPWNLLKKEKDFVYPFFRIWINTSLLSVRNIQNKLSQVNPMGAFGDGTTCASGSHLANNYWLYNVVQLRWLRFANLLQKHDPAMVVHGCYCISMIVLHYWTCTYFFKIKTDFSLCRIFEPSHHDSSLACHF